MKKKAFEKINEFKPLVYNYHNKTEYAAKLRKEMFFEEVILENHIQAFARQILGEKSKYLVYPGDLQCGFSYLGLEGCSYRDNGQCDGSINPEEGLQVACTIIEKESYFDGCTFGLFFHFYNLDIKKLRIENVANRIDFDVLKNILKKQDR